MIDKIINTKYFVCFFFLFFSFQSKEFIISSINKFYFFELNKTSNAKGVIIEAVLHDGMSARTFDCKYMYVVSGEEYKISETVSVDSVTNFNLGDSVIVVYNLQKHSQGTIDYPRDRSFRFYAAVGMLVASFLSVLSVLQDIYRRIKKKNSL